MFENGDHCSLIIQFLVEVKRPLPHDSCKLIMPLTLASLARVDLPAREGFAQRTQRTPRLERRSLGCPLIIWVGGRVGVAGVSGLSEPSYNGGWR